MYIHNLNPIIFSIGPFALRWYSLAYLFGFVAIYLMLKKPFVKKYIKNWDVEYTDSLITHLFVGLLIGARLMHIIMELLSRTNVGSSYLQNPLSMLYVWHGGLSFHGAFIGLLLATFYFAKKNKLDYYEIIDFLVVPISLFLVLGRIANFINAEMVGTLSSLPWCVNFPNQEGCRHPTVLYEAIKNLFIFSGLMYLRKFKLPKGTLFWTFVTAYGIIRFFLMFLRDEAVVFAGLTLSQVFSGAMFVIGSYFLWKRLVKW